MALLMTMEKQSDRELLELAAKAAGIAGDYCSYYDGDHYYSGNSSGIVIIKFGHNDYVWNPLDDDGDALRLAVKLGLVVAVMCDFTACYTFNGIERADVKHADDKSCATRLSIVRAAAEIGRRMQDEQSTVARS